MAEPETNRRYRPSSVMSQGREEEEDKERVRKSAAHHMMFDGATPWGVERGQGSVPQIKKKNINPDDLPAAGAKTPIVNPITGREFSQGRTEGHFSADQIQEVQNELSEQMIQKQQIENEFWKMGNSSRNKAALEKRKQIERSLEVCNQQVNLLKQKLRDHGAK